MTKPENQSTHDEILNLIASRKGHFLLESGHHGDLWLDLESLFSSPRRVRPLINMLASRLASLSIEVVCGPLIEGAFVGLKVASELKIDFCYSQPVAQEGSTGLFPVSYRIPSALRTVVKQKRVAIVNDVINAGSAMRGTYADLQDCGAQIAAIGTLLTLGNAIQQFAREKNLRFETLAVLPNNIWKPSECPLCISNYPLEDVGGFHG